MLGQWWMLTPTIIEMLIAAVLPAVFWVHAKVRSPLISLAVAPAVTFFFITVLSILFERVGISWQREHVLPVLGILTLFGALVLVFTKARELTGGRVTRGAIRHVLEERRRGGAEPSRAETSGLDKARAARSRVEPGRVELGCITTTGAETSGLEKARAARGRVEPEPVGGPIWAMVAAGSFLAALPMLLHANPELPAQQWDSTFHLNGVWSILQFGSASPFGGLSDLYGGRSVFYPTTWHAFTALFSTSPTVIRAANASSIVLMIMWVLGASALTSVITRRRGAILAAPILAGLLLDMPADNLTMYNQWPNAMGLAAVPGVVALAVILGRRIAGAFEEGIRPLLRELYLSIFLLLGAAGASAAHPSSAFVLAALLIPALLAGSVTVLRRAVASGSWLRVILVTLIVASATLMPFLALTTSKIRAMGEYPRPGFTWSYALSHMFTPAPPFTETTSMSMMILLQAGLVLLGIAYLSGLMTPKLRGIGGGAPSSSSITKGPEREHEKPSDSKPPLSGGQWDDNEPGSHDDLWDDDPWDDKESGDDDLWDDKATPFTREHPREWLRARDWLKAEEPLWPIAAYLVFCVLTLLAYAPLGEVRTFLLAPWYLDARRIMGAHGLTMVPLMALGFDFLASIAHKILSGATGSAQSFSLPQLAPWKVKVALGLVLLTLSGFGALDSRLAATDYVYDPEKLGKPGMADTAELAMIRRMRLRIPGDSLVLGDPIAGAAYTEVLGQHEAVFPQLSMTNGGERWQQVLAHRFKDIHTDPEVCEVVRELGITHFYEDEDGWYYNFKRSTRSPGLYGVDTSMGFELVDHGGTAKLYRITACGEIVGKGLMGKG
ncbi:beta-carotene 15,15'-monooxygenase [Schaalia cardiffensis]|uniref:DUF6541 family protein n=1 Tax=Schaalia cardiffensis TaxID=181487 RepID=UPI0018E7CFB5|nr:DUF6541 family protein [Schaalia cardiffensis]MBJ2329108.1 beta-carotene 15,15'-monooxygenase [Schaalia cardiffensis]